MKDWHYGINSLYRTATLTVTTAPAWTFWLQRFADWLCSIVPHIRFPSVGKVLNEGEKYNWREWYGDTGQAFCASIHMPIQGWLWGMQHERHFRLPYEDLRQEFYGEDKDWWDENEARWPESTRTAGDGAQIFATDRGQPED